MGFTGYRIGIADIFVFWDTTIKLILDKHHSNPGILADSFSDLTRHLWLSISLITDFKQLLPYQ